VTALCAWDGAKPGVGDAVKLIAVVRVEGRGTHLVFSCSSRQSGVAMRTHHEAALAVWRRDRRRIAAVPRGRGCVAAEPDDGIKLVVVVEGRAHGPY